jgi:hypothetical protein
LVTGFFGFDLSRERRFSFIDEGESYLNVSAARRLRSGGFKIVDFLI